MRKPFSALDDDRLVLLDLLDEETSRNYLGPDTAQNFLLNAALSEDPTSEEGVSKINLKINRHKVGFWLSF